MNQLPLGTIIATRHWWGEHWMIVAAQAGRYTAISNSARLGGVAEEWLQDALAGRRWHVVGHLGALPAYAVIARARSKIGSRYSFGKWNCEDFARWAHGLAATSPQRGGLMAVCSVLAVGGLALAATRAR